MTGDKRGGRPRTHHDLAAWQRSIALVKLVYEATGPFPPEERFGLTMQMRRAAVSIPSNIAEGAARRTTKEFLHFLYVARGSLSELETQLTIAKSLDFLVDTKTLEREIATLFGILGGLIASLE